jgi:hypothetical protein
VGRDHGERPRHQQLLEHRVAEHPPLLRVGARTQFVEQHERRRRRVAEAPRDALHMRTEGRQVLGDRLLVADVDLHRREERHLGADVRRDRQAADRHARQQADGLQDHGLAAGVRTGDHQQVVRISERHVQRHDAVTTLQQ